MRISKGVEGAPPIAPSPSHTSPSNAPLIFIRLLLLLIEAPGRYDSRNRNLPATHQSGGYVSAGFPACETNWVSSYKQPNSHSCDHLHVSEPEILLLKT